MIKATFFVIVAVLLIFILVERTVVDLPWVFQNRSMSLIAYTSNSDFILKIPFHMIHNVRLHWDPDSLFGAWRSQFSSCRESAIFMSYNFIPSPYFVEAFGKTLMCIPFHGCGDGAVPSIHFIHQKEGSSLAMKRRYMSAMDRWHTMGVHHRILQSIKFTHVQHRNLGWVQHAKYLLIDRHIFSVHSAACIRNKWDECGLTGESYNVGKQIQQHVDQIMTLAHRTHILPVDTNIPAIQSLPTPYSRGVDASGVFLSKMVGDFGSLFLSGIIWALQHAEDTIDILTPNYNSAIIDKVFSNSSAKVRIIAYSSHNSTILQPLIFPSTQDFAKKHQRNNVSLRYYGLPGSGGRGMTPSGRDAVIHSKLIVIDGHWVFFGSMNMDRFMTNGQSDSAVLMDSIEVAAGATKRFEIYWADSNWNS